MLGDFGMHGYDPAPYRDEHTPRDGQPWLTVATLVQGFMELSFLSQTHGVSPHVGHKG